MTQNDYFTDEHADIARELVAVLRKHRGLSLVATFEISSRSAMSYTKVTVDWADQPFVQNPSLRLEARIFKHVEL